MVSASSPPATQFTTRPSVVTEPMARITPKVRASSRLTAPRGMGRAAVRCMRASMSASYHILSAPEAPAPTAMQRMAMPARTGLSAPGANIMPVKAVNTTNDITRGFIRAMKSATLAPTRFTGRVLLKGMPSSAMSLQSGGAYTDASVVRTLLQGWQPLVGVECRRRGQRPLQRRGADAPRIVGRFDLGDEVGIKHGQYEQERTRGGDVGTDRGPPIPIGKGVGIVGVAPRHAGQPEEMLREKKHVGADEGEPEVQLPERLVVHVTGHLWEPVVPAGEDREHRPE